MRCTTSSSTSCPPPTARTCTSADAPNAYSHAKRFDRPRSFGRAHKFLPDNERLDEEGDEICIEYGAPTWGEGPSGRELYVTLFTALVGSGWLPAENVPAFFTFADDTGNDCHLSLIVDDFFFTEKHGRKITYGTIALIGEVLGCVLKVKEDPEEHGGYAIEYHPEQGVIKLQMAAYIEALASKWVPEVVQGDLSGVIGGKELQDALDALTFEPNSEHSRLSQEQRDVRSLVHAVKWAEAGVMPILSLVVHRIICVASYAPPGTLKLLKSVLAIAYTHRHEGLCFGGNYLANREGATGAGVSTAIRMADGAPMELENHNDASYGTICLVGILVTYCGAGVYHAVKKVTDVVTSTHAIEAVATQKGLDIVTRAAECDRAMGAISTAPVIIGTDNMANALVASTWGSSTRSRHFLRRYHRILEEVREGNIQPVHIKDTENPSDFLTKWVPKRKLKLSLQYATNSKALAGDTTRPSGLRLPSERAAAKAAANT